ncbi:MAG TPA: hypothetical protein VL049_02295 [Candidatus Dormibacteraeota bacterium]|nr:hypothetical protein [Candidatus Dormibacteraeota bacterium]
MGRRNEMAAGAALLLIAAAAPAAWARDGGSGGGGTACAPQELRESVASTGLDADASARARWRQDDRCRRDFQVEVEDVPVGSYDVLVDGTVRGTIAAVADPAGGTRGELELESAGDDTPHAPALDFDPVGAALEIRGAAGIYFADVFDGIGAAPTLATPIPTRTAVPTAAGATPTAAASRTARPTEREDRGEPTRATVRATRTPTLPRATRTATPARTASAQRTDNSGPGSRWSIPSWMRWH